MKDNIYSPEGVKGQEPLAEQKGSFKFDQSVVEVFDDMIKRSVPGYEDIADLQSRLLAKYLHKGDRVYDLGCSIGHSLYTLKKYFSENLEVRGVDTSEPMLEKFKSRMRNEHLPYDIELINQSIQDVEFKSAKAIFMNFTQQFISREDRLPLLKKILNSLEPGGLLLISEKIKSSHPLLEHLQVEVHHDFKRANGYSDLEIHKKREALEEVLRPDTVVENLNRFAEAGFEKSEIIFKWFNFTSFVCIKKEN